MGFKRSELLVEIRSLCLVKGEMMEMFDCHAVIRLPVNGSFSKLPPSNIGLRMMGIAFASWTAGIKHGFCTQVGSCNLLFLLFASMILIIIIICLKIIAASCWILLWYRFFSNTLLFFCFYFTTLYFYFVYYLWTRFYESCSSSSVVIFITILSIRHHVTLSLSLSSHDELHIFVTTTTVFDTVIPVPAALAVTFSILSFFLVLW